jgi:hypothetical protein
VSDLIELGEANVLKSNRGITKAAVAGLMGAGLVCCAYGLASATTAPSPKAIASPVIPNIIVNGKFALPLPANGNPNFEAEAIDTVSAYTAAKDPIKTIPGWVVGGGGVFDDYMSYLEPPINSTQSIMLYNQGPGSLTQTVKTTAGLTYLLSWYQAGYPAGSASPPKVMHVWWDHKLAAAPAFNITGHTNSNVGWSLQHLVVTATSASSTVEFADATTPPSGYASMVGQVSLAAEANLFLPTSATVAPTGKLVAIVRTATEQTLSDPSLVVKLYGTWKSVSYGPATTQLIASGAVVGGQVVLQFHLPASLAHTTIIASATLAGADFIPVTHDLTIKVS